MWQLDHVTLAQATVKSVKTNGCIVSVAEMKK
jgi:hypothetical protein